MERITRRRLLAAGAGATAAGLGGCLGILGGSGGGRTADGDGPWRTAELTDVRSGETFTIADLSKPVLLETFAVWCSTCLSQQRAIRTLHERVGEDAVTSVTLNIDPNEDAAKVRDHLDEHGFDWRYAVSPSAVTNALVEDFGGTMTNAPSAPVVVVCADGARRLRDGVKGADALEAAISEGC